MYAVCPGLLRRSSRPSPLPVFTVSLLHCPFVPVSLGLVRRLSRPSTPFVPALAPRSYRERSSGSLSEVLTCPESSELIGTLQNRGHLVTSHGWGVFPYGSEPNQMNTATSSHDRWANQRHEPRQNPSLQKDLPCNQREKTLPPEHAGSARFVQPSLALGRPGVHLSAPTRSAGLVGCPSWPLNPLFLYA